MALLNLTQFKYPFAKRCCPVLSLNEASNPYPSSSFLRLPSCRQRRRICAATLQSLGHGNWHHERNSHSRPSDIAWSKDLANSVHLIGTVGMPVELKELSNDKALAWTRLGFKKSSSETSWINLTFWDELAYVAFQHLEKGNQVYVSGRLVSDSIEGENNKPLVYFKVVVQQLNFIEKNFPPVLPCGQGMDFLNSGLKNGSYSGNSFGSTSAVELWQAFFANPVDWWDNRVNKRNPKYPDFKHKHTGEALWIEGKNNPPWVKSQLAILDERMASFQTHRATSNFSLLSGNDFESI